MARQIVVDIIGDSTKFSGAVDDASSKAGKFGAAGAKGFGIGLGLGVFGLVTGAIGSVTDKLFEAQAAYEEDQASVALLNTALENNVKGWSGNTKAIEANISANQKKGVSDSMQREGLVSLLNKTQDATAAQELNNAAIELAAGTGKTYDEAVKAIISGLNGKGAALGKDGIAVTKNMTATDLAAQIMDKYEGSQDRMAKTAVGKAAVANEKVGESMERVGMVVSKVAAVALPILAEAFELVVNVVGKVWKAIEPLVSALVRELQPAFRWVVDYITKFAIPLFQKIMSVIFPALKSAVAAVAPVFKAVFGAIVSIVSAAVTGIGSAINTAKTIFTSVTTAINTVRTNITSAFNTIVNFIRGVPGRISGALGNMFRPIWEGFRRFINALIRGWNSLKFTMPSIDLGPLGKVGGFTIGTPNIGYLHAGGIVPGIPGSDQLAILQAGERVIPRKDVGTNGGVTVIVQGNIYGVDDLMNTIAIRLRLDGA